MESINTKSPEELSVINLTKEPIELYKILKFESLVQSGGEAKLVIEQGLVRVNGEVETQKRKKIRSGDTLEFQDSQYSIVFDSDVSATKITEPPLQKIKKVNRGAIPILSGGNQK